MALPVRAFGTVSRTSATDSAIRAAAPRPCTARAAISTQSDGAAADRPDPAVNRAIPASRTVRLPRPSPSFPALTTAMVMARR